MVLVERDYVVLREIERWRFCLGRHVNLLAGFQNQRACDRRLKLLLESGYLDRKKVIYGVPSVYHLTHRGKTLIGANKRQDKIRFDNINHDICVLDTALYFILKDKIQLSDITTEKQLHIIDGFAQRKHRPDFVYTKSKKKICVEVELTLKSKSKFEDNIKSDFLEYDQQIWVVPDRDSKIARILEENKPQYTNIKIIELSEVRQ